MLPKTRLVGLIWMWTKEYENRRHLCIGSIIIIIIIIIISHIIIIMFWSPKLLFSQKKTFWASNGNPRYAGMFLCLFVCILCNVYRWFDGWSENLIFRHHLFYCFKHSRVKMHSVKIFKSFFSCIMKFCEHSRVFLLRRFSAKRITVYYVNIEFFPIRSWSSGWASTYINDGWKNFIAAYLNDRRPLFNWHVPLYVGM